MKYSIISLSTSEISDAMGILLPAYEAQRKELPLLPPQMMGDDREVESFIHERITNGAVGLISEGQLIGFMVISGVFEFKGMRAAAIGEVCHAACGPERSIAYSILYEAIGEFLHHQRVQLHIVAHFACDRTLQESLYQLGFGAFLTERIRDLSKISGAAEVELSQEEDFTVIQEIESEHMRYYRNPPIYLRKDDSLQTARDQLRSRKDHGDALFVYYEEKRPTAYFIVGPCTGSQAGRILIKTNTAQIFSAYASPSARGRGIGNALLNRSIGWAQERGYSRLFVEHETANIYGGNFWCKHFSPYLYFSMRYIENCT